MMLKAKYVEEQRKRFLALERSSAHRNCEIDTDMGENHVVHYVNGAALLHPAYM